MGERCPSLTAIKSAKVQKNKKVPAFSYNLGKKVLSLHTNPILITNIHIVKNTP